MSPLKGKLHAYKCAKQGLRDFTFAYFLSPNTWYFLPDLYAPAVKLPGRSKTYLTASCFSAMFILIFLLLIFKQYCNFCKIFLNFHFLLREVRIMTLLVTYYFTGTEMCFNYIHIIFVP